jgi:hypothetical protein
MKVIKLGGIKLIDLDIKGQCVYVFDYVNNQTEQIVNAEDEQTEQDVESNIPESVITQASFSMVNSTGSDGLLISFTEKNVNVRRISSDQKEYTDKKNNSGLVIFSGAYYWFSLDAQNQMFYAGVGEPRIETVVYSYKFEFENTEEGNKLREENKSFLESICKIMTGNTNSIKLIKDPITQKVPMVIVDSADVTMGMLARGDVMPASNLPLTSQKLYYAVSGPKIKLDDEDFPYFSKAIEESIRTPGLWCYEKLKEKSTEFNKDKPNPDETYLRITLGQNNGESPGIPYVMEIWPPGHYSPVHSHAGAEAIIRILYGSIHVSLYPFLSGDIAKTDNDQLKPFGSCDFPTNSFTWLSPGLNQTHQLKNISTDTTCVSLNCYLYGESNSVHYDYFDYVDSDGTIQHYEPDSDMDFISFKNLMKEEWYEQNKKRNSRKIFKYNTKKLAI